MTEEGELIHLSFCPPSLPPAPLLLDMNEEATSHLMAMKWQTYTEHGKQNGEEKKLGP